MAPPLKSQSCGTDSIQFTIQIRTDQFPFENSWQLFDRSNDSLLVQVELDDYAPVTLFQWDFCLSEKYCYAFVIQDDFSDGIKGDGGYQLFLDGELIQENSNFGRSEKTEFNCLAGATCELAVPIISGTYGNLSNLPWFRLKADSIGSYAISTCGLNTCDTRLWIYEDCDGLLISYDQAGAIYFDDNDGGCGEQAQIVNALLEKDKEYFIRVGLVEETCADSIFIELKYNGPIEGCTDSSSCNFNPFATVDDGSCLSANDPNCPGAPDLTVNEQVLQNSMFLDTIFNESDNCAIEEGCLRGYGKRDIIRFSTRISNIGQQDFYVGQLSDNQGQFNEENCHMHPHFENYAEYLLFDEIGNALPVGFKNGFCVTDLQCDEGINKKYSCANMGITAGCSDVYLSDLECQWIDITGLPDGQYTLAIRINWNEAPDLLGRFESDYLNNWAQVCFVLDRSNGQLMMDVLEDCEAYADCTGQAFGRAEKDCTGACNGTAIRGDINQSGALESSDVSTLLESAARRDLEAEPCYDLNLDQSLSVFDAVLLEACLAEQNGHNHSIGIFHPYCEFPKGLEKKQDTAYLNIQQVDYENGYLDVSLLNPRNNIQGVQLALSGAELLSVEDLSGQLSQFYFSDTYSTIMGLSPNDKLLPKSIEDQALFRVYFRSDQSDSICIVPAFTELINDQQERISIGLFKSCIPSKDPLNTNSLAEDLGLSVYPNPFQNHLSIEFKNPTQKRFQLKIFTATGQVFHESATQGNSFRIFNQHLPKGVLFFQLTDEDKRVVGKIVKL